MRCLATWVSAVVLCAACGGRAERTLLESNDGAGGGASFGSGGVTQGGGGIHSVIAPLVPLASGHRWEFQFVPFDPELPMTEACDEPVNEVGAEETIQGVTGFHYDTFCGSGPLLVVGVGDALNAYLLRGEPPSLGSQYGFIHSPVQNGESWFAGDVEVTWASVPDSITVPAGTFWNCWARLAPPDASTLTYCRGAGLVAGVYEAGNWRLELVSKNF